MSKEQTFEQDYKAARRLERGSRLSVQYPGLIGHYFAPKYGEPRQWYASDTPSANIVWHDFEGVEGSGRLPTNYTHGIVLGAPLVAFAQRAELLIDRLGAAYKVGEAALFTRNLITSDEYLNDRQRDLYVAFGVGKGVLEAQLVVAGRGSDREITAISDIADIAVPVPQPIDELVQEFADRGDKLIWV